MSVEISAASAFKLCAFIEKKGYLESNKVKASTAYQNYIMAELFVAGFSNQHGKLMCSFMNTFTTALLCQLLCFSIVIMHITYDFTLFLSLGLFCGYFRRFGDNKVNINAL